MNVDTPRREGAPDHTERSAEFDRYRPLLFSVAYRMLDSAMDAEDMVQETFLRWERAQVEVTSTKAYLTTILTNLCLDRLRSAQHEREQYAGPWLPEPLPTGGDTDLAEPVELAESLSVAFLVVLETLAPVERAAFLLREVFDYPYDEVASILGKNESNIRQIVHRAKEHVAAKRPRFQTTPAERERVTRQFQQACTNGDLQSLLTVLAPDVVFRPDGGGKVSSAMRPIYSADHVARFVLGYLAKAPPSYVIRPTKVNGQPALVGYYQGRPYNAMSFDIVDGRIKAIYNVLNPDKLRRFPSLDASS